MRCWLLLGLLAVWGCAPGEGEAAPASGEESAAPADAPGRGPEAIGAPPVRVHYVGHSAFLLAFGEGPMVLTDYGESNAYGLNSPIHPLAGVVPDVVTLSHGHADHAGGQLPERISTVLDGEGELHAGGLSITSIPTFEGSLEAPDNASFLFEFRGLKILHLGDCQGLIVALAESDAPEADETTGVERGQADPGTREEVASRIRSLYPDHYDLVLLPIGFVRDILEEAAEFVTLLDARMVVPMHYWAPGDRDAFLEMMDGRRDSLGRPYRVRLEEGAELALAREGEGEGPGSTPEVVGLTPAPPG